MGEWQRGFRRFGDSLADGAGAVYTAVVISPVTRLLCGLALTGMVSSALAGASVTTKSPWSFHVWQSDDGLPNNNVTGLAQTSDGYLWTATPTRLARFDGVRFEEFSPQSIVPWHGERVSVLLSCRDRSFWMAMDHGPVVCLKDGRLQVFADGLPDQIALAMTEDEEGSVWIIYRAGLLYRIKEGKVRAFNSQDGLSAGSGPWLALDGKGRLWFAKGGQVGIFRNERFEPILKVGDADAHIRVTGARGGGVWICRDLELLKGDENGRLEQHGKLPAANPGTETLAMLEDRSSAVWIGTSAAGLFRHDNSGIEAIPTSHSEILSLLEDREGNLWAGTGGGGLDRIQPRAVELEGPDRGLPVQTL
jgi:ligand-binding sensor domain-containing protein